MQLQWWIGHFLNGKKDHQPVSQVIDDKDDRSQTRAIWLITRALWWLVHKWVEHTVEWPQRVARGSLERKVPSRSSSWHANSEKWQEGWWSKWMVANGVSHRWITDCLRTMCGEKITLDHQRWNSLSLARFRTIGCSPFDQNISLDVHTFASGTLFARTDTQKNSFLRWIKLNTANLRLQRWTGAELSANCNSLSFPLTAIWTRYECRTYRFRVAAD